MKRLHFGHVSVKVTSGSFLNAWPTVTLKAQVPALKLWKLTAWRTVSEVTIHLKEYWRIPVWVTSEQEQDLTKLPPLRMSTTFGEQIETWYPQAFNLEQRANDLVKQYLQTEVQKQKAAIKLANELKNIK